MTTIESKKVSIGRNISEVEAYVCDLNNFEKLLPKERISDFESDGDSCSFKIQGMTKIGLVRDPEHSNPILLRGRDAPFDFSIKVHLSESEGNTDAFQRVELDLNPMMKMMVEKPLRNLFDHIADRLKVELG